MNFTVTSDTKWKPKAYPLSFYWICYPNHIFEIECIEGYEDFTMLTLNSNNEKISVSANDFAEYFELYEDKKESVTKMDIQRGDKVFITGGIFAGSKLTGVTSFIDGDTLDVKLSDGNIVNVRRDEVMFISRFKKPTVKKKYKKRLLNCDVDIDIRGRRTTVTLDNGVKGSVYCSGDDEYIEENGVILAFKKALSNWMLKEIEEGNVNIN